MAISYYGTTEETIGHYRSRRLSRGHVVTNDFGAWVYLSDREFAQLQRGNVGEPLLSVLRDKGIILNESNISTYVDDYQNRIRHLSQGASLHIFVPTLRCQQACLYCHANAVGKDAKGYDMDEETARKTVDFILQSPSHYITIEFQGGEPLLNFDIVKYAVRYGKQRNKMVGKNLKFSIVTNLVDMDEEKLAFLRKEKVGICTSLDGPEHVHDRNRGDHATVVKWIRRIKDKGFLNAMMLATRHTLPYPDEVVDEYFGLGLLRVWIKPANSIGRAARNWGAIGIEPEPYIEFWKKALERIVKHNSQRLFTEQYTAILLKKLLMRYGINFTDLQSPCGAVIGQLAYSYDGSIYTCDEGRIYDLFRLGTVENCYEDIVRSDNSKAIVKASINDNPVCEKCAYKPVCGLCPVCSYAQRGNIIPKLPDKRCEILIAMFDYLIEKIVHDRRYREVFMKWADWPL